MNCSSDGAQSFSYDENGRLISAGDRSYSYALNDRLIALSQPGLSATFAYNGDGVRLAQTENGSQDCALDCCAVLLAIALDL